MLTKISIKSCTSHQLPLNYEYSPDKLNHCFSTIGYNYYLLSYRLNTTEQRPTFSMIHKTAVAVDEEHQNVTMMITQLGTIDMFSTQRISLPPVFKGQFSEANSKSQLRSEELRKDNTKQTEEEHDGIQYLKVYFEFAYYCLVCPFRFVWDPATRTYSCYTNRVQTVSSGEFGIIMPEIKGDVRLKLL
jgi:hypothetical protein